MGAPAGAPFSNRVGNGTYTVPHCKIRPSSTPFQTQNETAPDRAPVDPYTNQSRDQRQQWPPQSNGLRRSPKCRNANRRRWRRNFGRRAKWQDRKSTRLNSSHVRSSYAVFCLKKKNANKLNAPSTIDT